MKERPILMSAPMVRAILEGRTDRAARQSYQTLWDSINGPGSWERNPWVWVIEFKRIQP